MKNTVHESLQAAVSKQIDLLWEDELAFLKKITSYRSTLGNEAALQNFMADYFQRVLGLEVDSFVPDIKSLSKHQAFSVPEWPYDGRPVVVGTALNGKVGNGKSLILQGHIDVVSAEPVASWDYPPFEGTIEGNRMYGRGVQDMKSGVAAFVFAYRAIMEAGIELDAPLTLQSVIEEECTGNGALAALEKGYTADAALIPEPFGQKVVKAQVGVIWTRITVKGVGAHTERAHQSVNAIEKSMVMLNALKSYQSHVNSQPKHDDFKGHPHPLNVNIGKIHSGDWPSSVPSECVMEARVGFYPGQDPQDIKDQVKAWLLKKACEDDWLKEHPPEILFYGFHAEGVALDDTTSLFHELEKSHEAVSGKPLERTEITCTTDIRHYNLHYGIPATCYGPVGGNMHGINEWVDLDSLKEVTAVYADFILRWCGIRTGDERGHS
jgi:acetylornithine deacetylase